MSLPFRTLCLLTVASIASCASAEPPASNRPQSAPTPQTHSRRADEENVREAVFRYALSHYGASCKVVFLCVEDRKDPSPSLLTRFANNVPPVKPLSASASALAKHGMYQDRVTKQSGILCFINKVDWKSSSQAVIQAGYMSNPQGGVMSRFVVKQSNGKWVVASEQGLLQY